MPDPEVIDLWPDGAPDAVGDSYEDRPTLTVHLPPRERATGAGAVIFPGGAYGMVSMDVEGHDAARWLNAQGIAGFVLEYRVAPRYRHPAPLQDGQRAMQMAFERAAEWGLAPDRIGLWGFSAGGHLAALVATRYCLPDTRPRFLILAYPVISMAAPYAHHDSRANLLGDAPDQGLLWELSAETLVTHETPPTFLFNTNHDPAAQSENSVDFYLALRAAWVPAELHIYERGEHGGGLNREDPVLATWADRLADWLRVRGLSAAER